MKPSNCTLLTKQIPLLIADYSRAMVQLESSPFRSGPDKGTDAHTGGGRQCGKCPDIPSQQTVQGLEHQQTPALPNIVYFTITLSD